MEEEYFDIIGEEEPNELSSEEYNEEVSTETVVEDETMETISVVTSEYMDEVVIPKIELYGMSILITLGIIAGIISAGYLFKKV